MDVVAKSDSQKSLRNLSRPNPETLETLESWGLTSAEPVGISEIIHIRRSDFRNF